MSMKFTILGCGSSMGVPRVAQGWGACDPNNPKNRRRRCSLLVEKTGSNGGVTRLLVDTSPDLRDQLLDAGVARLDGVLYTHEHADHTHGIDDLRPLFVRNRRPVDVYCDDVTSQNLNKRFGYCFRTPPGSGYPPTLREHRLIAGQVTEIMGEGGAISVLPVLQNHGDIASLGFRFGSLAYSADIKALPPESLPLMAGLAVWIVDALRHEPHPSHMNLAESLDWIRRIGATRAVLTNLHADLDYDALRARLPAHVEPAFDGMEIFISSSIT
jgi:phosphoribosyl 1,2-cyclic phosphate phosphodiesterase